MEFAGIGIADRHGEFDAASLGCWLLEDGSLNCDLTGWGFLAVFGDGRGVKIPNIFQLANL
jgi:hypothetical protein